MIPLLNKGPHVRRSLGSVLNQTAQDFEVIVVDGGSEDNGLAVVEKFASLDSRIRLVQQEGKGVSEARNQGIRESKSELIAFLDADDEWMPNYLETVLKLREKYPCAGLYATSIKNESVDNILSVLDAELRKLVPEEGLISDYFKIHRNRDYIFGTSTVAVPLKVFSELGGFQAGYSWGEDIDMWCRIALKYPVAYTSQACATYYQNTVNSAVKKKKAIKTHPFVKTAREALNAEEVPRKVIKDLTEYINLVEMDTAIHDVCIGDNSLAFSLLTRNDTRIFSKIKLLYILSIYSKNNLADSSKAIYRKRKAAVKFIKYSSVPYRQGQAETRELQVNLLS